MRRLLLRATTAAALLALSAPMASAGESFSGSLTTTLESTVDGVRSFPFAIHTVFSQDWRTWPLGNDTYRTAGKDRCSPLPMTR
jgi:hypothetical protein